MDSSPEHRPTPSVLVTGASGFIGRAVCRTLLAAGHSVVGLTGHGAAPHGALPLRFDLTRADDFDPACPEVDGMIHLAGLAHVPAHTVARETIWRINVDATRTLAQTAARRGMRFVYLSSAKVLGESGEWGDDAPPAPVDLYAQSKLAAEEAIRAIPGLDYTILRPPLVYGPHVKGNFLRLLKLADSPWPLPFAALTAPRSLLCVENLAAAICACFAAPTPWATGRTWLVADDPPLSTAELVVWLRTALGRPDRLWPLPPTLLAALGGLTGRQSDLDRLSGRFVLHADHLRARLGWRPVVNPATALHECATWYRKSLIPSKTAGVR